MRAAQGFTLLETLVALVIISVLAVMLTSSVWQTYREAGLAISANNIHQLAAGGMAYLADHNHQFWPYRTNDPANPPGTTWWFGFESQASTGLPEGQRILDPSKGPLGGYVPAGIRPDPSFEFTGKAFKPKYKFGYIGIGYNVLIGGNWSGTTKTINNLSFHHPGSIVVFATSAQVNNFQAPASASHPMIEEFYGLDQTEVTVHFVRGNSALVSFADGSGGFLPMDPTTRDSRAPQGGVGRFAPVGSKQYLLETNN